MATDAGTKRKPAVTTAVRRDRLMGWTSVAIGAAQVLRAEDLAHRGGIDEPSAVAVVRGAGVGTLVVGAGLLTRPQPSRWLWAKSAQDVAELAALAGFAWQSRRRPRRVRDVPRQDRRLHEGRVDRLTPRIPPARPAG